MNDDHLGLDALADATAHALDGRSVAARHLDSCAGCSARLAELRAAEPSVRAALAAMPVAPIPDDIAARLEAALGVLTPEQVQPAGPADPDDVATVTTLPAPEARRGPARWLAAAAALAVVLAGIGVGVGALQRDDRRQSTTAGDATAPVEPVRNDTGTDYADRAALAAAIPGLLTGSAPATTEMQAAAPAPLPPQAAGGGTEDQVAKGTAGAASGSGGAAGATTADPLERLRAEPGLADCLRALLPPDDPSVAPLAIDYARYRGIPAMVVVLPGVAADKLDVFVVGSGCSTADDSTLFYASVPAP